MGRNDQIDFQYFNEQSSKLFFVLDNMGRFIFANKACIETLKLKKEDLLAQSFYQYIHEEDQSRFDKAFRSIDTFSKNQLHQQLSLRLITKKSQEAEMDISLSNHNGCVYCQSEEKFTLDNLRESHESISKIAKIGDWRYYPDNDSLHWGREMFRIHEISNNLNISLEEATKYFSPESRYLFTEQIQACLEYNKAIDLEFKITTAKQHEKYVRVSARKKMEEGGEFITGTYQDITEQKTKEQILLDQNTKIIRSSRLANMGEMAAGIAHEINNPLAIIIGFADRISSLIGKEEINKEKIASASARISEMTERIASIIKSLRQFSRDASKDEKVIVRVSDVVDDALTLSQEKLTADKIIVKTEEVSREHLLKVQRTELSQAIYNLIINSQEHLSTNDLAEKWISITSEIKGDRVILYITDSGMGIPQNIEQKILNPFFTTKEIGKGMGLGLPIAKSSVETMNGKLYYNKSAQHTQFIIELPYNSQRLLRKQYEAIQTRKNAA
ncbi:MAG: ATP-binding protein [Bdellovibrionota bacterium]|nr:ATP-binding protein [Bdellovibrionota bacterium]